MSDVTTPMMQQYQRIRSSLPADTLLFFRVGDFYEMFFDDAKEASAILDLTLTKKGVVPMAGVPFHSADSYIQRIIKAGKRVAICEQLGEPVKGQVVQREITQVVSPGTVSDAGMLDSKQNNFLAAVSIGQKKGYGFAFIDLSTGDFRLTELADTSELASELARVRPVELLVSDEQADELKWLGDVVVRDGYPFLFDQAYFSLTDHFKVKSLDGFGCGNTPAAVCAAGAILHYLKVEMRRSLAHVKRLKTYRTTEFMILDATTQSNLELVKSRGGSRDTSLLKALDRTVTPMGARRLQDWILHPLCEVTVLNARQQMVADLLAVPALIFNLRDALKGIRDIERLLGRLTQSGGNARDLQALCVSLQQIPQIHEELGNLITSTGGADQAPRKMSVRLLDKIKRYDHLVELLSRAIVDEPPALTKEGGMFREGYYPQLDELHAASRDGRDWIAQLQQRLVDETGIKSLRVKYTSVFGYFIEVTTSNLSLVPETWHRKQTISNGERFITPELKEMEGKILGADERSKALEYELFVQLRDEVLLDLGSLQTTAETVGILDVMCSFAETARLFSYCRPKVHTDSRLISSMGVTRYSTNQLRTRSSCRTTCCWMKSGIDSSS